MSEQPITTSDLDAMSAEEYAEYELQEAQGGGQQPEDVPEEPTTTPDDAAVADDKTDKPDEPEDDAETDPDEVTSETVSFKKFDKLRRQRDDALQYQEANRAREALRDRELAEMREQLQRIQQPQEQPYDPYAHAEHLRREGDFAGAAEIEAQANIDFQRQYYADREAQQQQQAQQEQVQAVLSHGDNELMAANRQDPNVADAVSYLMNQSVQEFMLGGATEPEARAMVQQGKANFYAHARSQKMQPSQFALQMAQLRGWQPPKPEAADPQPDIEAQTKELAAKADKRRAAKSMGSGGSAAPEGSISSKEFMEMSDAEASAFAKKHGKDYLSYVV